MDFSIRPAREEDAASMIELLNPIIEAGTYTVMDKHYSVEEQIDFIRDFPDSGIFYVAVCNQSGCVLGMQDVIPLVKESGAQKHVGEISTFVSLDSLRIGIGKALMKSMVKETQNKGYHKLTATIRADNVLAISYYQSQGFKITCTINQYACINCNFINGVVLEQYFH